MLSGPWPVNTATAAGVAQAGPGIQGVALVQRRRVARPDGSGDATLGVAAVAVVDAAFGYHQYATVIGRQQRGVQAGDTTADDDVVVSRFW